jgi:hypothetical protein
MNMKQLPHWARIAFAARRARKVLPLFDEYWPGVLESTRRDLEEIVQYAEQAAAKAKAGTETSEFADKGCDIAGGAILGYWAPQIPWDPEDGPMPPNQHAANIACNVAKTAEFAVRASGHPSPCPPSVADGGYGYFLGVVNAANRRDLLDEFVEEFNSLVRVAKKGKWNHATPVPPEVFDLLERVEPEVKPFWKFW